MNIPDPVPPELKYQGQTTRIVPREEAIQQLESLINRLNPTEITRQHEGFSKDMSSNYGIIKLISDQGNYRIFYYSEKSMGEYLIKRIRVNKL